MMLTQCLASKNNSIDDKGRNEMVSSNANCIISFYNSYLLTVSSQICPSFFFSLFVLFLSI